MIKFLTFSEYIFLSILKRGKNYTKKYFSDFGTQLVKGNFVEIEFF